MNAGGEDMTMDFAGEVAEDGKSMKGTASMASMGDATWSAARKKTAPTDITSPRRNVEA